MALSLFSPKVLCAEVTGGIDLESRVLLTGDRVTVGSAPGDGLRLGARNVVGGHLTFQRQKGAQAWEYFSSDRGHTAVDRGNPRTGPVRPGMFFILGGETRIDIVKTGAPADLATGDKAGTGKTVPLAVALPAMGLMVAGFALYMASLAGGGSDDRSALRTTPWFNGSAALDPAIEACLAAGLGPEARRFASRTKAAEPDALFRAALAGDGAAGADLVAKVRGLIADSHLLAHENRFLEASRALRRLEYVLPVGNGDCPILSAARLDLAILELRDGQR